MEFMKAAGFKEATVDNEAFFVWSSEYPLELLNQLCEALDLCEVIQLEIDRNVKVLLPSQAETVSLPPDFFRLSKEEILNEQKTKYVNPLPYYYYFYIYFNNMNSYFRTSAVEDAQILKTKVLLHGGLKLS